MPILTTLLAATAVGPLPPGGRFDRQIEFAGTAWSVKASDQEQIGPGPNRFSDSAQNVWVDSAGRLHLKITQVKGKWQCAEIRCNRSLGYGTYGFRMETPMESIDRNAVLGFFTWSDNPVYNNREIDVEISRWGRATGTNLDHTLQPADVVGNRQSYFAQSGLGATEHSINWTTGRIQMASVAGDLELGRSGFSNGVPVPGDERIRFNLWLFRSVAPALNKPVEVVISGFSFTPELTIYPQR